MMTRGFLIIGVFTLATCSIAFAGTWYVKADGTGDAPTIQAGIDSAAIWDTVMVADGVYVGDGNRDISFRGKMIVVQSESGFPEQCVIDCGGPESGAHRGFHFGSGADRTSILEGFTITGGNEDVLFDGGGAIYFGDNSRPTIRNCIFEDNFGAWGGAIICKVRSAPVFEACHFVGNSVRYDGGAVDCQIDSYPSFTNCTFADNVAPAYGGAVIASDGASPSFTNCLFIGNHAALDGGALFFTEDTAPTMVSCTLCFNSAGRWGGGILCKYTQFSVLNTIIAYCTNGDAVYCGTSGAVNLSCCDVYGNADGDWIGCISGQYGVDGNISEPPLFCDPDSGDFTLDEISPCAPDNSPQACGLIGALPPGCAHAGVPPQGQEATWGAIKATYK